MTIRSNPPGALVYIDDQEIGRTPVSTSFTYYGTRKIRLVREGYETNTVMHRVNPPWYQIPPLDFFSENLYPRELRDERFLDFDLEPQQLVPREELVGRANELRSTTRAGFTVPMPGRPNFDGSPNAETEGGFPPGRDFGSSEAEQGRDQFLEDRYRDSNRDRYEDREPFDEFPENRYLNQAVPANEDASSLRRIPPPFYAE